LRRSTIAHVYVRATASDRERRISTVVLFDRSLRVFHNACHPFVDGKPRQKDSTELVEADSDTPFILSQ